MKYWTMLLNEWKPRIIFSAFQYYLKHLKLDINKFQIPFLLCFRVCDYLLIPNIQKMNKSHLKRDSAQDPKLCYVFTLNSIKVRNMILRKNFLTLGKFFFPNQRSVFAPFIKRSFLLWLLLLKFFYFLLPLEIHLIE